MSEGRVAHREAHRTEAANVSVTAAEIFYLASDVRPRNAAAALLLTLAARLVAQESEPDKRTSTARS